jgi:uncharacterized protein
MSLDAVYKQIGEFSAEAGARRVLLFGSRARGDNLPKSDIDLAVEGCPDTAALADRLQNELWTLLKLDIVDLDSCTSDELRDEIERDKVVLYEAL